MKMTVALAAFALLSTGAHAQMTPQSTTAPTTQPADPVDPAATSSGPVTTPTPDSSATAPASAGDPTATSGTATSPDATATTDTASTADPHAAHKGKKKKR